MQRITSRGNNYTDMEAIIKIQLSDGLTPDELEAFIAEGQKTGRDVSAVVVDALREQARKFRQRQARQSAAAAGATAA